MGSTFPEICVRSGVLIAAQGVSLEHWQMLTGLSTHTNVPSEHIVDGSREKEVGNYKFVTSMFR